MACVLDLRLNELSGTVADALVGADGAYVRDASLTTVNGPGNLITKGQSFSDATDAVQFSGMSVATGQTCSIEIWFKTPNSPTVAQPFIGTEASTASKIQITNATSISVRTTGNMLFTVPTILVNTWYHVLVTKSAADLWRVFLNGAESTVAGLTNTATFAPDRLNRSNGVSEDFQLAGFRAYNTDESANAQILFSEGRTLYDNLVSYWKLDEASGNALDSHGINTLVETSGTIGSAESARDFVATDSEYFEIVDNPSLSITGSMTICAWVKADIFTGNPNTIVSKYQGAGVRSYHLSLVTTTGRPQFVVSSDGTATTVAGISSGTFNTGQWYFVCGRFDDAANLISISVNAGTPTTTAFTTGIFDSTAPFRVGEIAFSPFDGLIKQIGIWNRALSDAEVTALYNGGAGWTYTPLPLTTNLVSYWKLDEASGNAVDSHGSNTLTETSGTIAAATGKINGARDFEALDSEVFELADNVSLSITTSLTITAWINLESITGTQQAVALKDAGGAAKGYRMILAPTTGQVEFRVSNDGNASVTVIGTNFGNLSTGTWYFVCGRVHMTNIASVSVNAGTPNTAVYTPSVVFDNAAAFQIGNAYGLTTPIDGLIDEVGIWNRALSDTEVTQLYNAGAGLAYPLTLTPAGDITTGLTDYWNFSEGSGATATSTGSNATVLTIGGATPPTWGTGKFGGGVVFTNAVGYLNGPDSAATDLYSPSTLAFKAKFSSLANGCIVTKFADAGVGANAMRGLRIDSGALNVTQQDGNGISLTATTYIPVDIWHDIVITVQSGVDLKLYIDGVLRGTAIGIVSSWFQTNGPLRFGAAEASFFGSGVNSAAFVIDEVRIYQGRALDQAAISALYALTEVSSGAGSRFSAGMSGGMFDRPSMSGGMVG